MISNQFLIVKPPYLFAFKLIAYLFQSLQGSSDSFTLQNNYVKPAAVEILP